LSSLFEPASGGWLPTEWSRSPWGAESLHGGAPAALLARELEQCDNDADAMRLARMTVELVRPVPVAPLSVTARVARPGKRVQLLEAELSAGESTVARAVGLRIARASLDLPGGSVLTEQPPPPPEGVERLTMPSERWAWTGLHNGGMDIRVVEGSFFDPGPAAAWFRLCHPVVPGEEPSPFQRAAAAGDFGNGLSQMFGMAAWMFINPDLTVSVFREPVGEWVALRSRTYLDPNGSGMAESELYDSEGRVGRATQSLLVMPR
jgi:hypothetical protein